MSFDEFVDRLSDWTARRLWWRKKGTVMAEKKEVTELKRGDTVKLLAPHVSGILADVLDTNIDGCLLRIASSDHPSGHSQEGSVVIFQADQLELVPFTKELPAGEQKPKEVSL